MFILDARVDRESVCTGGYNAVLVIQKNIFPWQQANLTSLKSTLSIWNLGQLIVKT